MRGGVASAPRAGVVARVDAVYTTRPLTFPHKQLLAASASWPPIPPVPSSRPSFLGGLGHRRGSEARELAACPPGGAPHPGKQLFPESCVELGGRWTLIHSFPSGSRHLQSPAQGLSLTRILCCVPPPLSGGTKQARTPTSAWTRDPPHALFVREPRGRNRYCFYLSGTTWL